MTFTRALSTNNYGPAKFIVDGTTTANGTHSTIATALTSASSGDTIFIRPGTYSENITLKAGVNLTAFGSDSSLNGTGKVIISGTCTMTTAGSVSISGIQLQTNSAVLLAVTGSAASIVNLLSCYLNCTNNTGITFSSSSGSSGINLNNCTGDLGTTGIGLFTHSASGTMNIDFTKFTNSGSSLSASTVSAGVLAVRQSSLPFAITSSSTASFGMNLSVMELSALNTKALILGGSGAHAFINNIMASGTATTITVTSTVGINNCIINTTNATAAIDGAGSINYDSLCLPAVGKNITVTTQSGGAISGIQPGRTLTTGYIGEQVRSAIAAGSAVSLTNNTAANITSISLTAGIWDVSLICLYGGNATIGTFFEASISTTSATRGTKADASASSGFAPLAPPGDNSVSVPSFRLTLTSTTTVYFVGFALFSSGTCVFYGRISATRVG